MIESIGVWAIASIIFVKVFGYPVNACLSAFYIMAGFGLLIGHKRRTFKTIIKGIGDLGKALEGYGKGKEGEK